MVRCDAMRCDGDGAALAMAIALAMAMAMAMRWRWRGAGAALRYGVVYVVIMLLSYLSSFCEASTQTFLRSFHGLVLSSRVRVSTRARSK